MSEAELIFTALLNYLPADRRVEHSQKQKEKIPASEGRIAKDAD